MSDQPSFFSELKRRNVYKVAVAYAVVAWLLIQAASIILPTFEAPGWTMKVLLVALVIGFPIAIVLAWAFEITPEGIRREKDLSPNEAITTRTPRKLVGMTIMLALIAAGLLAFQLVRPKNTGTPRSASDELRRDKQSEAATGSMIAPTAPPIPEKSIAVLPFTSLSEDKANAYFADGIQEEILTRLAKIADLKVISRTSTQQYQSKPGNLSEIAKQLGVANILEGSVQKVAGQVRVNVQLINAQTDSHLWAETYDRKLTDIFGVESEIAKAIAESLQAKLTGREEQALAVKPTNNPEAYDAYLRALALEARIDSSNSPEKAISAYEQAVQLDPAFALAWARLSRLDAALYFFDYDATAPRREAAKRALDQAQKLQPNSPETQLALAYYQYHVLHDYELAQTTLGLVAKMLPGSSEVPAALAAVARRQEHWNESIAYWEQALALDPRNVRLLTQTAATYAMLRQFPAALKLYDRALDIRPNDLDLIATKAGIYQAEGNLEEASKSLPEVNALTPSWAAFSTKNNQLTLERNYGEAVRLLQARLTQFHFGLPSEKGLCQVSVALALRLAGDSAGAKIVAEEARKTLEPLCKNQPDNGHFAALLSQAYAMLGDKNSALQEAQRAVALSRSAKGAANGPKFEENLAWIQMTVGEKSRAISTLARLLEVPYENYVYGAPITPALLRLDPTWDPLRADPAFRKLCEEKKP